MATDASGYVYVGSDIVAKYDGSGNPVTQWTLPGYSPQVKGIAIDSARGTVYAGNQMGKVVNMYTTIGGFLGQLTGAGNGYSLFQPTGVAVDPDGNVFVACSGPDDYIEMFSNYGVPVTTWQLPNSGEPYALATDSDGYLYVTDLVGAKVIKYLPPSTTPVTTWDQGSGPLGWMYGIAVDPSGSIYVANTLNTNIQVFTNTGTYLTSWGSYGSSDGQFGGTNNPYGPYGLAVDSAGNVYAVDLHNSRIEKFGP